MKRFSINLLVKSCVKYTGKTKQELARKWAVHYFLTRSKTKAYWRTIFS